MTIRADRIAKGQCPNDGKEAAPYRLCYDCRQLGRLTRVLHRGERIGIFQKANNKGLFSKKTLWALGPKKDDPEAKKQMKKWEAPWHLPESDKRGRPKLHGSAVDVEATLVEVIRVIGRPCTEQEIIEAWGRLRSRRKNPLASDLSTIIKAADKRKRRARKLAEIEARRQQRELQP